MMSWLDRWVDLPVGAKVVCVVLGGGGLSSAAYLLIGDPRVFLFIGIGLAILAGLFVGYRWLLKKRKARKSKPFEEKIAGSGGASPREVSDPSRRAQMDSLRKKFDEGLRVYRQRGKDLYSVPWYVVIGEPASGKSAAIRNSGVGFPPGLHEEMQGVGGTINMDWFFTNDAVILDTAGRLAFEEVETAKTTEWKEFLRLLRIARPRCPINGMLLFIPVDSLKNDTADELEEKARKIAQQLDFVQLTLGVRFPLSIVISKADLLVGFSEYFEGISDPREQYQIFGWSNPKSLDQAFLPREIGDALGEIQERVIRRRTLLLKEPAPQTLVADRRIDEVDRLFLLPDEIERIAPRLQRYLELFFAGGQWSAPPPFLRGVYFTSALREGEAVDLALAEAIGMEASDVQEDRAWESKRSFFLHDVFMEKIFRERGLVTSAPSPGRAKQKRRAVLYGAVAAILLGAIGLTVYSGYRFWDDLKEPERHWNEVAARVVKGDGQPRDIAAFKLDGRSNTPAYWGGDDLTGWKYTRAGLANELGVYIDKNPLRASGLFAVFSKVRLLDDLGKAQRDAQRALLNATVVRPLLSVTSQMLAAENGRENWSEEATRAYAAVLDVWTLSNGQHPQGRSASTSVDTGDGDNTVAESPGEDSVVGARLPIADMWSYFFVSLDADSTVLEGNLAKYKDDLATIERAMERVYGGTGTKEWPPKSVDVPDSEINDATDAFLASWTIERASPSAAALLSIAERLKAFHDAESKLSDRSWFTNAQTVDEYEIEKEAWETSLGELRQLARDLDSAIEGLEIDLNGDIGKVHTKAADEVRESVDVEFSIVFSSLPARVSAESDADEASEGTTPQGIAQRLTEKHDVLTDHLLAQLQEKTAGLEADMQRSITTVEKKARYRWRLEAYEAAGRALAGVFSDAEETTGTLIELHEVRASLETRQTTIEDESKKLVAKGIEPGEPSASMREGAEALCQNIIDAGAGRWRHEVASELLAIFGDADVGLHGLVERDAGESSSDDFPGLFVTVGGDSVELVRARTLDQRFAAESASRVFEAWLWLDEVTKDSSGKSDRFLERSELRSLLDAHRVEMQQYAESYVTYWSETFREYFEVTPESSWSEYHRILSRLQRRDVNRWLSQMAEHRLMALRSVQVGVLSREAGEELDSLLDAAARATAAYKEDDFNDRCGDIRRAWTDLPGDDASAARQMLLTTKPGSFQDDYLFHSTDDARRGSLGFWDSLNDHLLRSLAASALSQYRSGLESTGSFLRKQPYCRGGQMSAPSGNYADVAASIDAILGGPAQGERKDFARGSLGAGAETGIDAVDDLLDTLRGAGGQLSDDDRQRFERVRGIAEWLDMKPQVTIQTLARASWPPQANDGTEAPKYVSINGSALQSSTFSAPFGTTVTLPDSNQLTFAFSTAQSGGQNKGSTSYAAPWGVLDLLWQEGVIPGNFSANQGKPFQDWIVPIRVDSGRKQIWIGLSFSEPLPFEPKDWPSCNGGN